MRPLIVLLLWLSAGTWAQAQDSDAAVALFADTMRVEADSGVITATGNVEAFYQGTRLAAEVIRYDSRSGEITAEGPIVLQSGEDVVLLASLAQLSGDFQAGLIEGARLILDQTLQVSAAQARRSQGRYNTLYSTVATSCVVCKENPTPIWRVRATRVVHDEARERLYFENAWLDLFGVPVLYLPRMRVPAPGVERATGWLIPSVTSFDVYGLGVRAPYYITLGDHADATLTPFVTSEGAAILEAEFRREFGRGRLEATGAYALDDGLDQESTRGFLDLEGTVDLERGFVLDFELRGVSDRSFLRQFGYSDDDRLISFVSVNRIERTSLLDIRAEGYQTLREEEDQGAIPLALPWVRYRRYWRDPALGGMMGVDAGLRNLTRPEGRDVLRADLGADWERGWILDNGLVFDSRADLDAQAYRVSDDPAYPAEALVRAVPAVGAELRWPLVRTTQSAAHIVEPVAQLLYSGILGDEEVPNEDSLLVEFDETNLFSANRFPGHDRYETGLRANLGVNYTRYDPSGWNLGATLGRVFKTENDEAFAAGSGLRPRNSDYVAAVSLELPDRLGVIGRSLFDSGLAFKRGELEIAYASDPFDMTAGYTFLRADASDPVLGTVPEQQELALTSRYRVARHWEVTGEWRYDIAAKRNIYAEAGVTYGNECITAQLALGRRFTSVPDVPPSTEIAFDVALAGFGGSRAEGWPTRSCRGN